MRGAIRAAILVIVAFVAWPSAARAQAVITGVVKDASGAVLPGVTVEAASPALIEKVRSAVSDGSGQYRIIDLRPGTYDVTFTLTGFNTVKREGITLAGTATASINADLKVGSVTETITVTGQAPLVDVQSIATERSISRDLIDAVPTGRSLTNMAALIPGIIAVSSNQPGSDVGGSSNGGVQSVAIHGGSSADQRQLMDGLPLSTASGNTSQFFPNLGSTQEFTIDTSGVSAEDSAGGVRINVIPREGGNQFHTTVYADATGSSLQSANYNSELAARGFPTPNPLKTSNGAVTFNPAGGGPIIKDKLWVFFAANRIHNQDYRAIYPNLNAGNINAWLYVPDTNGTYPVYDLLNRAVNGRITWQVSPKNKLAFYTDYQAKCICPNANPTTSPEATGQTPASPQRFISVVYTAPVTNRFLLEAAGLNRIEHSDRLLSPLTTRDFIKVTDSVSGITYRSVGETQYTSNDNSNFRLAASLVTGAHAFKAGFQGQWSSGFFGLASVPQSTDYTFANGVPTTITEFADPRFIKTYATDYGIFAQDRWTVKRLTLTGGLRWDYFGTHFPAATLGPIPLAPTRNISYPESDGAKWKDITFRMGGAYDLFGNGKTAVRASLNKYLGAQAANSSNQLFGQGLNPVQRIVTSTTRSWTDSNKNFVPDCNLLDSGRNGECGPLANSAFGQAQLNTTYDPAILNGYGLRDYNWEFATGLQQQVGSRLSVEVGYYRRWYGNWKVTDNTAVAASDFTQFSIVAPVDSRLPGGGGYTVSGLYNVSPAGFGQTNNFITMASNYGDQTQRWQGVDVSANVRAWTGLTFQGGFSTGSTLFDNCAVRAQLPELTIAASSQNPVAISPTTPWCRVQTPYLTQVKGFGSYRIPKIDMQVSAGIQSSPGVEVAANFNATNAFTQASLGRALSGGAPNVSVNLVSPGTLYGDRVNQVDLRVGKTFRFAGSGRFNANVDMYNVFNASPATQQQNNFSTTVVAPTATAWQAPQAVLPARIVKISAQFDF